jgi:hypothetical protein
MGEWRPQKIIARAMGGASLLRCEIRYVAVADMIAAQPRDARETQSVQLFVPHKAAQAALHLEHQIAGDVFHGEFGRIFDQGSDAHLARQPRSAAAVGIGMSEALIPGPAP